MSERDAELCECGHARRQHSGAREDDFMCLVHRRTSHCLGFSPRIVAMAVGENTTAPAAVPPNYASAVVERDRLKAALKRITTEWNPFVSQNIAREALNHKDEG